MKRLLLPYSDDAIGSIESGDEVLLSGVIYTGRDQVHKRLAAFIGEGKELPFDFAGSAIYYMGPSPAPEGFALGEALQRARGWIRSLLSLLTMALR